MAPETRNIQIAVTTELDAERLHQPGTAARHKLAHRNAARPMVAHHVIAVEAIDVQVIIRTECEARRVRQPATVRDKRPHEGPRPSPVAQHLVIAAAAHIEVAGLVKRQAARLDQFAARRYKQTTELAALTVELNHVL